VHDTHFVVAHFHFTMFGGTGFAFFAALHYWWPKMFGILYNFRRAYIAATLATVGFMFHYVPMFILGLQGMPRRYYDYLPQYAHGNELAAVGGILLFSGVVLMLVNLLLSFRTRVAATANPWGGCTLEWTIPSPPPLHNFEEEPQIKKYPYDFSDIARTHP
jgi:cytochrome c oxidase subunit 1